jgi:hypothetical protein
MSGNRAFPIEIFYLVFFAAELGVRAQAGGGAGFK